MKCIYAGICGLLLVGLIGCTGGTTGGNTSNTKTELNVGGPDEGKFSLDVPNLETDMKQGEAKQVTIGIKRGKNFDQDVALHFENLPKGVTVDPPNPTIKAGEKDAKVTVKADDKAALGEAKIKVVGKPAKGAEGANEFQIEVKAK